MRRNAKLGWCAAFSAVILLITALGQPFVLRFPLYDFIEYATAARLFVSGHNPYSVDEMMQAQRQLGWTQEQPLMMLNPPWFLPMLLPLGFMQSFALERTLWFWLSIGLLALGVERLWRLYGGPPSREGTAFIVAALFFPSWYCLVLGQLAPVLLLGLVGFLYFERRGQFWLAGSALALTTIKPHLFYLLWLALLPWSARRRDWRVLAGTLIAVGLGSGVALTLDRHVFTQYLAVMTGGYASLYFPGIGGILRHTLGRQHQWLQFTPVLPGLAAFLWYWRRHAPAWNWRERMPVLLTMSVLTSSYGWLLDEPVLLLPVVVIAIECLSDERFVGPALAWCLATAAGCIVAAEKFRQSGVTIVVPLGILLYFVTTAKWRGQHREDGTAGERARTPAES